MGTAAWAMVKNDTVSFLQAGSYGLLPGSRWNRRDGTGTGTGTDRHKKAEQEVKTREILIHNQP